MNTRGINPAIVEDLPVQAKLHGVVPTSADVGPALNALLAEVSASTIPGRSQTVIIDSGTYVLATTVDHPANVRVQGSGPSTIFQTSGALAAAWDFATGFLRAELADMLIQGPGRVDPTDYSLRTGIGIDLAQTQQVIIEGVQVWDFLTGIRGSNEVAFASYNVVRGHCEVNRCTTGIYCPDECNNMTIKDSRIFFSHGVSDEGVGIDINDAHALNISSCSIEPADTCIRVRSTDGQMQARITDCFLEPGTNPTTLTVGSMYDVDVESQNDGLEALVMEGNTYSGNNGNVVLPPEAFVRTDGYSRAFFGARYDGAAGAKRNLIWNGTLNNYAIPDVLPNWVGGGVLPTIAQDQVNFVTGVRSLSLTAPSNTGSTLAALFTVSDPGVEWVTCGVRYRVAAGNTGFFFTGAVGSNAAQLTDEEETPAGTWRTRWVQVRVDPADRTGSVSINPDSVDGTGNVLIDEVWAVPGRYAVPSTQHADRIVLLPAPIQIVNASGFTSNQSFGPIDITDLPAVLAPPLDDFSAAPLGVVGGVFRASVNMTGFATTAVLGGPVYAHITIPGSGATTVAASTHFVMATFGQSWSSGEVTVRATSISGGCVLYTGLATSYIIELVAWVVQ